ncbi:MAG: mechanosensitive ion channel family protein [Sulfurimonadaceae bacterium]|jgi:MscS family membrane protein|nr:mechanosensitive ion channel family protein [Sulfurimonadaceae bacterium]
MEEIIVSSFVVKNLPFMSGFDPMVVKLTIIAFSIGIIYIVRRLGFDFLEASLLKIKRLENYSKDIIKRLRKPSEIIIIILNFDIIFFVYNDFTTIQATRELFNITYVVLITYWIYLLINAIAGVKIEEIEDVTKSSNVKNEVINVGLKILNFAIVVAGILVALNFMGVNLTAILSGLGIGGIAVALAAKDSLANFFGTISILMSDSFSQGDWIEIGGAEGTVVEIGLRVTTIRTFDNALISVPNNTLANGDVKNWNKRTVGRRIKMSIGITYDSKAQDIKNAIKEIREMLETHPRIATQYTRYELEDNINTRLVSQDDVYGVKKTLLVFLDEFKASSMNILIYCFSTSVNWSEWLAVKEDVMFKIMDIFERNNLEFAFPSLSIYEEKERPEEPTRYL